MKKTILESIVGSTVHGTSVEDGLEDLDLMAIVLEDSKTFIGFYSEDTWTTRTKPEGVRSEAGDIDHVAYGLKKFLTLALKGNPSILLGLFAPEEKLRVVTDEGRELRALTPKIVSRQVIAPFSGYMRQQHERLLDIRGQKNVTRPELIEKYGYDTKYAGHIIRLGLQGEEILLTGRISLPMKEDQRTWVVDVRTGRYSLHEVSEQILEVEARLSKAYKNSPLPPIPDRAAVEKWMISTYVNHWSTQ